MYHHVAAQQQTTPNHNFTAERPDQPCFFFQNKQNKTAYNKVHFQNVYCYFSLTPTTYYETHRKQTTASHFMTA